MGCTCPNGRNENYVCERGMGGRFATPTLQTGGEEEPKLLLAELTVVHQMVAGSTTTTTRQHTTRVDKTVGSSIPAEKKLGRFTDETDQFAKVRHLFRGGNRTGLGTSGNRLNRTGSHRFCQPCTPHHRACKTTCHALITHTNCD
jgi:hypothetical protein